MSRTVLADGGRALRDALPGLGAAALGLGSGPRTRWLAFSVGIHLAALALVVSFELPPAPEPPEPLPIELLREPQPPREAPKPETPKLRFRPERKLRVRDPVQLPRSSPALVPPPPGVPLTTEAASGGLAVEVSAPSLFTGFTRAGEGGGIAGEGVGAGNGVVLEGASFAQYLGQLREVGLDVVFVMDATGTMGPVIHEVKERVRDLAAAIRRLVPVTRFGIVAYRDDGDAEFVSRVQPLTLSVRKLRRFLDGLQARGGGDVPEAVGEGLRAAMDEAGWDPDARWMIVLVGDAPPHAERLGATLERVRAFRRQGGTLSALDVSFDGNPHWAASRLGVRVEELTTLARRGVMPEFQALAEAGGGDAATLQGEARVVARLAVLVFGDRYAEELRPLLGGL